MASAAHTTHPPGFALVLNSLFGVRHSPLHVVHRVLNVVLNAVNHLALRSTGDSQPSQRPRRDRQTARTHRQTDRHEFQAPSPQLLPLPAGSHAAPSAVHFTPYSVNAGASRSTRVTAPPAQERAQECESLSTCLLLSPALHSGAWSWAGGRRTSVPKPFWSPQTQLLHGDVCTAAAGFLGLPASCPTGHSSSPQWPGSCRNLRWPVHGMGCADGLLPK